MNTSNAVTFITVCNIIHRCKLISYHHVKMLLSILVWRTCLNFNVNPALLCWDCKKYCMHRFSDLLLQQQIVFFLLGHLFLLLIFVAPTPFAARHRSSGRASTEQTRRQAPWPLAGSAPRREESKRLVLPREGGNLAGLQQQTLSLTATFLVPLL